MKILKGSNSSSGFSLVEVMVAIGILSVVSLGVMKLNETMFKGQKTIEQRANLADFRNRLVRTFTNQASCTRTLQGLVPVGAGEGFPQVWNTSEDGSNATVIFNTTAGSPLNNFGTGGTGYLTINSFSIQGFDLATANSFNGLSDPADITSLEPRKSGNARVVVQLGKPLGNNKNSYGDVNLGFGIDVTVVIRESDNKIVSCYADSNQFVQAMCTSLGGIYDATDGRCKGTNIYAPDTISSTTEVNYAVPFSMTAENGFHARSGVYIGTGVSGGAPLAGLQPGNNGLGVNVLIPPEGEIASSSHIDSGGNITAGNPVATLGANGEISAQSNLFAGASINAGLATPGAAGTVNANSNVWTAGAAPIPSNWAGNGIAATIVANQGDINAVNGKIVANEAILRNCTGGTVVADATGKLSCRVGLQNTCVPDTVTVAGESTTNIYAMVGYKSDGQTPECKKIMTFNNKACNKYADQGGDQPNNSTNNSVMIGMTVSASGDITPNCCTKGSGCPHPSTVCANGYDGVMDKCGFMCPGTKAQVVKPGVQQLVYGCEASNDTYKIVRNFPEYVCGPPEDGDPTVGAPPRSCFLAGNSKYHTFQQCRDAGGKVYFYSKVEGQQCITLPWFGPEPICWPTSTLAENGYETDAYCLMPQQNMAATSGRITSAIRDSCFNCGSPITATKAQIAGARKCPPDWNTATDAQNRLVYKVRANYQCLAYGLAEGGVCFDNGRFPPSKTHTFTGGTYYTTTDVNPAEWPLSYIEAADNTTKDHIPYNTCPAEVCDTATYDHGTAGCQDADNNRHHWAAFSCYAPIEGISCR